MQTHYLKCEKCCEEIFNPEDGDPLENVFRVYRERHGYLQPEALKAFRAKLVLNQKEMAALLRWEEATLHRFENGALQEVSHDNAFRKAMTQEGLALLLENAKWNLPSHTKKRLRELSLSINNTADLEKIVESKGDELSGFRKFQQSRFVAILALLCKETGEWKTKVNKLLFYADFLSFRETNLSLTGLRYVHQPFGPVPKEFQKIFASLPKEFFELDVFETGERIRVTAMPDLSVLSIAEISLIKKIVDTFDKVNATKISDISHEEDGYKETQNNEFIPYSYAKKMKIVLDNLLQRTF